MFIIGKTVILLPSEITLCADQVKIRLISQLVKSLSRALQKLIKYFNEKAIFRFVIPGLLVWSKNFDLMIAILL